MAGHPSYINNTRAEQVVLTNNSIRRNETSIRSARLRKRKQLEDDGKTVSEFLLVPYFGACIHVPPPPSNQIVLVRTGGKPVRANQLWDMVWVTGQLKTERAKNDVASASYILEATQVEAIKP